MKRLSAITYTLLALIFTSFCLSATETWHLGYSWHDQQRIYQLGLLCAGAPLAVLLPQTALPRPALLLLAGLLLLGLCSSALAVWPDWALKEWSRYGGLLLLALLISGLKTRPTWQNSILWAMAAIGFTHAFQFLVYYMTAFVSGMWMLDADLLFNGFSNPRFFGQFQVMLMPVMALLVERCRQQLRWALAALLTLALVSQWCIAFTLGGRGLWLGLLVSHLALLLINRKLWRILALQAAAALFGFLLFVLLFKLIPLWLGLDPALRDNLRTSLSGRERIWQWAWEMALANPWLGAGPMHYSATYNPIAAHPHQVVLQWLAEWGFAATLIALALGAWGLLHGARHLRQASANELDAGLWGAIVGALVLAQVDGVFVMPYTETWLALLIGLALARWSRTATPSRTQRLACAIIAIPVLLVLGNVLIREVSILPQNIEAYMIEHHTGWTPRFWSQGWIPM
ncbi:O-antigen ligase domain-containing protein [Stutzerimonas stutzeri]|uniref:O-antigen ligase domain-containing protein n=1 Tax=Stutzerimonas stutzeri TaxID=316 RepID=A0A2N8T3S8_STUST|nr:O-antigen ligase family protein [Stutzerimonas stutzeri]MCQ4323792.1 O-antigen ligase family protein [Stutzerimonas stutzeri]PNG09372.1 O-antigen ligase domain-containing protein [Stutzerimonas stutzeri]